MTYSHVHISLQFFISLETAAVRQPQLLCILTSTNAFQVWPWNTVLRYAFGIKKYFFQEWPQPFLEVIATSITLLLLILSAVLSTTGLSYMYAMLPPCCVFPCLKKKKKKIQHWWCMCYRLSSGIGLTTSSGCLYEPMQIIFAFADQ